MSGRPAGRAARPGVPGGRGGGWPRCPAGPLVFSPGSRGNSSGRLGFPPQSPGTQAPHRRLLILVGLLPSQRQTSKGEDGSLGGAAARPRAGAENTLGPARRARRAGRGCSRFWGPRGAGPRGRFPFPLWAQAGGCASADSGWVKTARMKRPPWHFIWAVLRVLGVLRAHGGNALVTTCAVHPHNRWAGDPGPEGPVWSRGRAGPRAELLSWGRHRPSSPKHTASSQSGVLLPLCRAVGKMGVER